MYGGTYGAVAANGTGMSTYVVDGLVRAPNYSETLVLVPGMGAVHDRPTWSVVVSRTRGAVDGATAVS